MCATILLLIWILFIIIVYLRFINVDIINVLTAAPSQKRQQNLQNRLSC